MTARSLLRTRTVERIREKKKFTCFTMYGLNVYSLVLAPVLLLILYAVYSRLRKPLEYRQLSSHVPSLTKSFWNEIKLTLTVAMKHPKGIICST